jgi:hypothetical protein
MAPSTDQPDDGSASGIQPSSCSTPKVRRKLMQAGTPKSVEVGLDKLRLWFDTAAGPQFDRDIWHGRAKGRLMARGNKAGLDINPSRLVDPDGYGLATETESIAAIGAVWPIVSGHVVPLKDLEEARVTRLDVSKDFTGAIEPDLLILGASRVHRPDQGVIKLYVNRTTGKAQSLAVGGKDNKVVLYNKHVETGGRMPLGALRWEAQVRYEVLKTFGIVKFGDITQDTVDHLAGVRWIWSKMSTPIIGTTRPGGMADVIDSAVVRANVAVDLERIALHGHRPASEYARRRLNDLIHENGMPIRVLDDPGWTQRMEWTTGTIVITLTADDPFRKARRAGTMPTGRPWHPQRHLGDRGSYGAGANC